MKIKSITPWFGGKRTLAPKVIKQLGEHVQYFEPFCGSLAVLLMKPPCRSETVNDLHGDMVNLARCMANEFAAQVLYRLLMKTPICEGLLRDARAYLEDSENELHPEGGPPRPNRAYWYFLASWMSRNGTAGCDRQDFQIAVRWTKNGGSPTTRWQSAVESIPHWHKRLLNVVILNRDAFSFIDRLEDGKGTAIYVDPPYLSETRSGFNGNTSRYRHEFEDKGHAAAEEDMLFGKKKVNKHQLLADILNQYKKTRIVVSYYDCPRVRELYDGWHFIDCTMRKNINQQAARTEFAPIAPKEAPEVLIVNGDPL